ncbi:unnamed protein product [Anisakis simplex]|uniref:RRM domain-containing protein n=1 Tax=Anisakis simplex TaxID=6269 RepID=A0A3P6SQ65_ANISI|nr:unnamed protein product [Anisakis simplex]
MLGVQNHAQFMMSVMRNFRDKVRQMGAAQALSESLVQGPSYESVKAILDRTGYQLEIYIGKIPNEIYEDALIPLFEECGKMWDLRLMMDPLTGKNRGYAFVTYCDKNSAAEAAKKILLFSRFPKKIPQKNPYLIPF